MEETPDGHPALKAARTEWGSGLVSYKMQVERIAVCGEKRWGPKKPKCKTNDWQ